MKSDKFELIFFNWTKTKSELVEFLCFPKDSEVKTTPSSNQQNTNKFTNKFIEVSNWEKNQLFPSHILFTRSHRLYFLVWLKNKGVSCLVSRNTMFLLQSKLRSDKFFSKHDERQSNDSSLETIEWTILLELRNDQRFDWRGSSKLFAGNQEKEKRSVRFQEEPFRWTMDPTDYDGIFQSVTIEDRWKQWNRSAFDISSQSTSSRGPNVLSRHWRTRKRS